MATSRPQPAVTKRDDAEIVRDFEDAPISGRAMSHRDHVQPAWLYLCRETLLDALARFTAWARSLADKYNETLTRGYVILINERMGRTGGENDWSEFVAANEDLLDWDAPILDRYYEEETLRSELARNSSTYVPVDRNRFCRTQRSNNENTIERYSGENQDCRADRGTGAATD